MLTTLQSYWTSVSIPSLDFLLDASADSKIYPTSDIWALLNFHSLGLLLVRQRRIVLVSSTGVPDKNEKMSRGVFLSLLLILSGSFWPGFWLWSCQSKLNRFFSLFAVKGYFWKSGIIF